MMSHQMSLSGQSGAPSNITDVQPLTSGPYTTYEWPVIQPTSAVDQKTSRSGFRSNTIAVVVATPVRYPPVVCTMPFGLAVEPDEYSKNSGCSASIGSEIG